VSAAGCHSVVEITAPDITPFVGNTDIPYATRLDSGAAGPAAVISALVHGNEVSGAIALVRLLTCGLRLRRGALTLVFANAEAYRRFDPADPRAARFIDEDMNRVWDDDVLDGPRDSLELRRARELRPLIDRTDMLLDLHSMQTPSAPLMLAGLAPKGRRLAARLGYPAHVVADAGHLPGCRLRDYAAFSDPNSPKTALLVEAGQHWAKTSVDVQIATCLHFLRALDMIEAESARAMMPDCAAPAQRVIEVTEAVTVDGGGFRFVQPFVGLEVIPRAGTVIAHDGRREVCTPYDDCVLIMPARRLAPGLTAVRLGRFVDEAG
jgi:predicted deacylase